MVPGRQGFVVSASSSLARDELLDRAIALHYEEMRNALTKRGHRGASASEVVHDLYLKLAEKPDSLDGVRSIRHFLIRAAVNLGMDRHRRTRLEQRLFSGTEAESHAVACPAPAPDHAVDVTVRLRVLQRAIAKLPARRRAVFILHRFHGMSADEIAVTMRISRNMVDRHLRRAFVHCLDSLDELDLS